MAPRVKWISLGILLYVGFSYADTTTLSTLSSKQVFLQSMKPDIPDEDQLLQNVNYKYFFDNGPPTADWYSQIVRICFGVSQPVAIEIGNRIDPNGKCYYDLLIKYSKGNPVKFNQSFFNASEGKEMHFFHIEQARDLEDAASAFNTLNNIRLNPNNIMRSVFQHTVEFYSNGAMTQECYLKINLWGKPQDREVLDMLCRLNRLTLALLKGKKLETAFLDSWTKELGRWTKAPN